MTAATLTPEPFDQPVVAAASRIEETMRAEPARGGPPEAAVVAAAPAGAESHFVSATVGRLRRAGLRVALAAPTNEQVRSLVHRVKQLNPALPVAFVHAQGRDLPADLAALPGVTQPTAAEANSRRSAGHCHRVRASSPTCFCATGWAGSTSW